MQKSFAEKLHNHKKNKELVRNAKKKTEHKVSLDTPQAVAER